MIIEEGSKLYSMRDGIPEKISALHFLIKVFYLLDLKLSLFDNIDFSSPAGIFPIAAVVIAVSMFNYLIKMSEAVKITLQIL